MNEQICFFEQEPSEKRDTFVANVFRQLGSSTHSLTERQQDDFYATEPLATVLLCEKEKFTDTIIEPCVGMGHIAEVLKQVGYKVDCYDIIDRGYVGTQIQDFLASNIKGNRNDIITNPPYKMATAFVRKALDISDDGVKIAMFLKIQFLESQERYELFKDAPPKYVYISSKRLNCARDGDFESYESSAMCYAWFVWQKGYKSEPMIRWINT